MPGVDELVPWWPAKRDAAKDKGSGMVGEFLVCIFAFFSDNGDCLEMAKSEFRDAKRWQRGSNRGECWTDVSAGLRRPTRLVETGGVPRVFQKSKELAEKGLLFERKQKPRVDGRL